jgi:hypothetical protein
MEQVGVQNDLRWQQQQQPDQVASLALVVESSRKAPWNK